MEREVAALVRDIVFQKLLPSKLNLGIVGTLLYFYQASGLKKLVRMLGFLPSRMREVESLAPEIESPFFFGYYGRVLTPPKGRAPEKHRVAFMAGCIANISFARLNEATVRVLQKNGCEVSIPRTQTCCGALHVHAGIREKARELARQNIDALLDGEYDAIVTNAGGCGSTLKEYGELLEHDAAYAEKARRFSALVKDVNEFLASIELNVQDPKPAGNADDGDVPGFLPSCAWAKDPFSARGNCCRGRSGVATCARCRFRTCAAGARASITLCIPGWRWRCSARKWTP